MRIGSIDSNSMRLYSNMEADVRSISSIADDGVFFVITQVFSMIGGVVGLFIINSKLAVLAFFLIPVKFLAVKLFADKRERIAQGVLTSKSVFAEWFGGFINVIRDIRLFGLQPAIKAKYADRASPYIDNEKKLEMISAWNAVADRIIIEAFNAVVYIFGAFLFMDGQISVGGIFSFVTYLVYISSPISAILNLRFMIAGIIPSIKRFTAFLHLPQETEGEIEKVDFSAEADRPLIEFDSVTFAYTDDGDQPVLKDVSLKIYAGQHIGLLGSNGSGKSTLLNLLLRFYDPLAGMIYYQGRSIADYSLEQYRGIFAVVAQSIYIFDGTIDYNISLGQAHDGQYGHLGIDLTALNKEMHDFTSGADLSGGQRQKIALARALFSERSVFVFDEPTSSLDDFSR